MVSVERMHMHMHMDMGMQWAFAYNNSLRVCLHFNSIHTQYHAYLTADKVQQKMLDKFQECNQLQEWEDCEQERDRTF